VTVQFGGVCVVLSDAVPTYGGLPFRSVGARLVLWLALANGRLFGG
jgi:hypothetical protein